MTSGQNIVILLLCLVLALASCHIEGNRVLVLLDDLSQQHSYSIFFNALKERDYTLSFFKADDASLALTEYGEYLYDHLIIFSPTVEEFGGLIDVPSILDFIDDGHNVLLAASSEVSDSVREVASECGVDFDEEGSFVTDHLNYDENDPLQTHNVIVVDPKSLDKLNDVIVSTKAISKPIAWSGIGADAEGSLTFPLLNGAETCYSAVPNKAISGEPHTVGTNTVLVSALQARNNARVIVSGSVSLFSDKYFNQKVKKYGGVESETANKEFCVELSKWVFKEKGLLKAGNLTHKLKGDEAREYRIKDELDFSIEVQEYKNGAFVPFVRKNTLQVEFTMIDPYIRSTLDVNKKGRYSTQFKIPDVYGVFTFRVEYSARGYTGFTLQERVPVRPYRHDEFERFIPAAFPYYASAFSMLAGLFLFSVVWLYGA